MLTNFITIVKKKCFILFLVLVLELDERNLGEVL